jgi:aryl-alcohol dehydrogenase-like predicted oxidoreductase
MKKRKISRRSFIKTSVAGSAGLGLGGLDLLRSGAFAGEQAGAQSPAKSGNPRATSGGSAAVQASAPDRQANPAETAMPKRPLGRTGHQVCLFSLGGQALLEQRGEGVREKAVEIINRALDLGVNYCDTAPMYGPSQDYFGEVMKTRRKETFLASKTDDRSRDGSLRLLEDSLKRLHTDHLDLWQLHHVGSMDDLDEIFRKGGALEAQVQARDQKMVRYLGITGHFDPATLREGLRRFDFDCILMALNAADRHHLPFQDELLGAATEKKMGIIGMKVPARGRLLEQAGLTMKECVEYVWSLPVSTVIIGCSSPAQVQENVALARGFRPLAAETLASLESRTRETARNCSWYKRQA